MTIYRCKSCRPENPCIFDTNSTIDDVEPDRCPIEDYQHTAWEEIIQRKKQYKCYSPEDGSEDFYI